jgi:formylmethanofuran dehydrogenase subunit E
MKKQTKKLHIEFKIVCIACGETIREHASDDSYGLCLRCFYRSLATRLRAQKRAEAGEFVSDR